MRTHLLLLPAALAATQVYMFPAPAGAHAPTLNVAQASAVMSHHLGGDVSAHDTPEDEGVWAHLMRLWDGGEKRAHVVILEGGEMQDILPASLSSPSFYLADDAESVLEQFKPAAAEALDTVARLPVAKYVKELLGDLNLATSKIGQALTHELAALIALADPLWPSWSSTSGGWNAVRIRLVEAAQDSALWEIVSPAVQNGLKSVTKPDSPPLLVIVKDTNTQPLFHYARQVEADAPAVEAAKNKTNSTGTDYSAPFVLLTGTTILLLFFVIGGVALLFSIGEQSLPSTLNLSVGGRKHD
ncbi:hypothetical protein CC85DRAFT_286566 [Cutaneotrichosporon oleaginosum]|uniref:Vacuolar sorting protein Vps3844 C-terminal domain-containing protein n=1 Tax=Cutaneotrichosporon oleaginosum TaxID=879819 RepID=A0A0J1B1C9_9TREE|nr:uncharacterized protein CC85DRAFT_286566 [Cutaneotrichosporon oleaginosum]KLT41389.1 hypothetical protein CC85DRAFT_286566 [Cutaneotrichosporon oleaginosum]TXT06331.1 hypothetical protein COLE_05662 [Cutaneotrichosporon oleaginosum]